MGCRLRALCAAGKVRSSRDPGCRTACPHLLPAASTQGQQATKCWLSWWRACCSVRQQSWRRGWYPRSGGMRAWPGCRRPWHRTMKSSAPRCACSWCAPIAAAAAVAAASCVLALCRSRGWLPPHPTCLLGATYRPCLPCSASSRRRCGGSAALSTGPRSRSWSGGSSRSGAGRRWSQVRLALPPHCWEGGRVMLCWVVTMVWRYTHPACSHPTPAHPQAPGLSWRWTRGCAVPPALVQQRGRRAAAAARGCC